MSATKYNKSTILLLTVKQQTLTVRIILEWIRPVQTYPHQTTLLTVKSAIDVDRRRSVAMASRAKDPHARTAPLPE